jgi:hypothetical protein
MSELSDYVAISPITLECPRCRAKAGEVCDVLIDKGIEVVHVERIKAALRMDVEAKGRLAGVLIPSQPAE